MAGERGGGGRGARSSKWEGGDRRGRAGGGVQRAGRRRHAEGWLGELGAGRHAGALGAWRAVWRGGVRSGGGEGRGPHREQLDAHAVDGAAAPRGDGLGQRDGRPVRERGLVVRKLRDAGPRLLVRGAERPEGRAAGRAKVRSPARDGVGWGAAVWRWGGARATWGGVVGVRRGRGRGPHRKILKSSSISESPG